MIKKTIVLLLAIGLSNCYAQLGKDAAINTIATPATVVNAYTNLVIDATAGSNVLNVSDNTLNSGAVFGANLEAGDLLFIIQVKGVTLNATPVDVGGGDTLGFPNNSSLGAIINYNTCGNYEFVEVESVTGSNIINLRCNLQNSYTAAGSVQVVRVPRFENLTINTGAEITAPAWDGTVGGLIILEVSGDLVVNGSIDADGIGFRGGTTDNTTTTFAGQHAGTNPLEGARKGEGIAGYNGTYSIWGGMYGKAAFANAGGGGTAHNSGGGGGANAAGIPWIDGLGNPDISGGADWIDAWNLEGTSQSNGMTSIFTSGGGGRGGYSWSNSNQNAVTTAPGNAAWSGDNRRVQGGLGGRPLDYSTGRLFFGGGGGAGEMNDNDGGDGGAAGGLIFARVYGNVSGSGAITANGQNGADADGPTPFTGTSGADGAGGGGAGGTVVVRADGTIGGIGISADGGDGGDQQLEVSFFSPAEAQGPGGGGGGGYIATTASTAVVSVDGGANGTTNSAHLTEFTPNGATGGSVGIDVNTLTTYGLTIVPDTICGGGTASLSANIYGTPPAGASVIWYSDLGSSIINTGNNHTTGILSGDTTFYVGLCDGGVLIPVHVVVSPVITIDASSISIVDETCAGNDGSITGLVVTGGIAPLNYNWNGSTSASSDTTGLAGGTYNLTVTDANGCIQSFGPVSVSTAVGPSIDITGLIVSNENCGATDGSIAGITVSGSGLTYQWNGVTATGQDTTGLAAGNYTLTVTDVNGCSATEGPIMVLNNGAPVIDATTVAVSDETCSSTNGSIVGITASGGIAPLEFSWNGASTLTADTIGLSGGSYTLTVTDAMNCSATYGPVLITDLTAPSIDTTSLVLNDENCDMVDGSISGIVTNGNGTLIYAWNGNNTLSADTMGLSNGSYTLTVQDTNGCISSMGPVVIDSIPGPTIDDNNLTIAVDSCSNGVGSITGITVSGLGPMSYAWDGMPTSTADTVGLSAGMYNFSVTDSNGCVANSGPYTLTSTVLPVIDTTGMSINDENCGMSDGAITGISVTGGIQTYLWNGIASTSQDLINGAAGTYTIAVIDTFGCVDSVGPITLSGTPPISIVVNGVNTLCEGQSTMLSASGATSYNWNPGGAGASISVSPTTTTTYQVIGASGPCLDTVTHVITVDTLPLATISGDTSICVGEVANLTASGGTGYVWTTTDVTNSISISPTSSSVYGVIVSNGCGNDTTSVNVTVNSNPAANAGSDETIILGNAVNLNGSGGILYSWSPSVGLSCTNCSAPSASPTSTTTYILTVEDANGCIDYDSLTVFVEEQLIIYIPNVFSPNGDGSNDVLFVRGGGIDQIVFRVFDRWGNMVFESADINTGWDGTYQGQPAVPGVYAYGVQGKYLDGSDIKQSGNVTLIR